MAVKYKNLKSKLDDTPLNGIELETIATVEKYIDRTISSDFDNQSIRIDSCYVNFERAIPGKTLPVIKTTRKRKMRKELDRRYEEAGWKINRDTDDGQSMHSWDYWVVTGKK